jgi:hypothetical protein
LAVGLTDTTFTWETSLAQGTDSARLIVEASDGWHTAEATSSRFALAHKPPITIITEPYVPSAANAAAADDPEPPPEQMPRMLVAGQPVLLKGIGLDLNDGSLDGEALRWASDRQGPLGIGSSLRVTLESGQHRLVLQAISSSGLIGEATVSVEVLVDRDGDGMPDSYEDRHGCLDSRRAEDRDQDPDRDGVTSLSEFRMGTLPCHADSDGDGVDDGEEILGGSDPWDPTSVPLPTIALQPDPVHFTGCGRLPPPNPRRIRLERVSARYSATTDASWLQAEPDDDGNLLLRVDCGEVLAGPATAEVLLTAEDRQPLIVPVLLTVGEPTLYLPLLRRD